MLQLLVFNPAFSTNHIFFQQTSTETQYAAGNRLGSEGDAPPLQHSQCTSQPMLLLTSAITQLPPLGDVSFLRGVKDWSLIPRWVSQ